MSVLSMYLCSDLVLQAEAVRFEQEILNSSRKDGVEGIVILPGVRDIMTSVCNERTEHNDIAYADLELVCCFLSLAAHPTLRIHAGLFAPLQHANTLLLLWKSLVYHSHRYS